MSLFDKMASARDVRMLCGMTIAFGEAVEGRAQQFAAGPAGPAAKTCKASDHVLLALHYYSQILSRYSKNESRTYDLASELRQMVYFILDEGVWPGSDLVRYARVSDRMAFVPAVAGTQRTVRLALIRPVLSDDLEAAVELPADAREEELSLSVVAVLQGLMAVLDPATLELLDRSLRYLQSYHEEGADWTEPGAVRNMPNRAFRAAGGDAA